MKAILLAAGVGERLRPAHHGPKCLLDFAGRTLLDRHLDALAALGVRDITLCLGHASALIESALARRQATPLIHYNPSFTQGSMLSLWYTRQTLNSGDDVLIMDADVLYDPTILARLVNSANRNCYLLDRDFQPGEEPVKLCMDGNRIVEFRKRLAPGLRYDRIGESVGFFKLDARTASNLAERVAAYVAAGRRDLPHEEALRDLALSAAHTIGVEDVTGLPWIEIDYPEDVTKATQEVLPRIDAKSTI